MEAGEVILLLLKMGDGYRSDCMGCTAEVFKNEDKENK